MALRDQPYIPLYIQDYLTDEKLNECSASSQGIYIKIMCLLHKSGEYGVISLKQKDKQTFNQLKDFSLKIAKHLTFSIIEIESAITELISEGVLIVDGDKLIQKRMVKDNSISLNRSKSGKKGGEKTQFALKFAKSKNEANSEDEIEDENEDRDTNKKEKEKEDFKREICPFYYDDDFQEAFNDYLKTRKKLKATNSERAIKTLLNKIMELSGGLKQEAIKLIDTANVNAWKSVYPEKSNKQTSQNNNKTYRQMVTEHNMSLLNDNSIGEI